MGSNEKHASSRGGFGGDLFVLLQGEEREGKKTKPPIDNQPRDGGNSLEMEEDRRRHMFHWGEKRRFETRSARIIAFSGFLDRANRLNAIV